MSQRLINYKIGRISPDYFFNLEIQNMKKAILFLFLILGITSVSISQTYSTNCIVKIGGTNSDTVNKNTHQYYNLTATPFVKNVAYQVSSTRTSGNYTKMYATLQKSYDKTKWYPVDSVLIYGSGTSLKFKKDITAVNSFYYRRSIVTGKQM